VYKGGGKVPTDNQKTGWERVKEGEGRRPVPLIDSEKREGDQVIKRQHPSNGAAKKPGKLTGGKVGDVVEVGEKTSGPGLTDSQFAWRYRFVGLTKKKK